MRWVKRRPRGHLVKINDWAGIWTRLSSTLLWCCYHHITLALMSKIILLSEGSSKVWLMEYMPREAMCPQFHTFKVPRVEGEPSLKLIKCQIWWTHNNNPKLYHFRLHESDLQCFFHVQMMMLNLSLQCPKITKAKHTIWNPQNHTRLRFTPGLKNPKSWNQS